MMFLKYHSNTEEEEADEWDEKSTRRMMLLKYHANTEEDADEWDEMPRRSSSPCLSNSNWSNKGDANILRSTLHLNDEVQEEGSILPLVQEAHDGHHDSSSIDFLVQFLYSLFVLFFIFKDGSRGGRNTMLPMSSCWNFKY